MWNFDEDISALSLEHLTQDEINHILDMDNQKQERLLLFAFNAVEGLLSAFQKAYPRSKEVPSVLKEPVMSMVELQNTMYRLFGWLDEDGKPTTRMPD